MIVGEFADGENRRTDDGASRRAIASPLTPTRIYARTSVMVLVVVIASVPQFT
jgi:hypothetical protein